jgi:hypothetical protein
MSRPTVEESLVGQIWERQAFDPRALAALGFHVVFRGVPSDAGGPDYQDALLLRDDGSLVTGDIEFHSRSSGWYVHGHSSDPRYNRVVLHVVWEVDRDPTVRSDGVAVPTLAVAHAALSGLPDSDSGTRPPLAAHPCTGFFARMSAGAVENAVDAMGWIRFQARAELLAAELESDDADQVAFRALLEGLGHASNREAFRALADAVPYGWLMAIAPDLRVDALLAGAGLSASPGTDLPSRLRPETWRLSRLRPGNHPARRITAVTILLDRFRPTLATGLADNISICRRPADLRRLLVARGPEDSAIGAGRADELAASAVLPLVAALDPELPAPRLLFASLSSPPSTRWTRAMLSLLAAAGHEIPVKRAVRHQGMHVLYTRYCRREGPVDCPVCGRNRDDRMALARCEQSREA